MKYIVSVREVHLHLYGVEADTPQEAARLATNSMEDSTKVHEIASPEWEYVLPGQDVCVEWGREEIEYIPYSGDR